MLQHHDLAQVLLPSGSVTSLRQGAALRGRANNAEAPREEDVQQSLGRTAMRCDRVVEHHHLISRRGRMGEWGGERKDVGKAWGNVYSRLGIRDPTSSTRKLRPGPGPRFSLDT